VAKTITVAIVFTVLPPDRRLLLSLAVFHCPQWSLVVLCRLCGNYTDWSSIFQHSAACPAASHSILRCPAVFRQTAMLTLTGMGTV